MACPDCQHPNDEDFNFCQRCGYKRKHFHQERGGGTKLRFPVDEREIANRVHELRVARDSSRYSKQKTALELEFSSFLSALNPTKNLLTALPCDVIAYLVWKDRGGRTMVHKPYCEFASDPRTNCGSCPKRLAHGTVDSLIGKLRAIFADAGRGVEWHCLLGVGNPAADRSVKSYLTSVREEQLKAHVTPRQAEPVLISDLEVLSQYIQARLSQNTTDALQTYVLARDQAVFKAMFFSGDRAADLLGLLTHTIMRFPDNSGLLFNQVWSKTLREGDSNVFALKRGTNPLICPVSGLEMYFRVCKAIKIKVFSGFLFRSVSKHGNITSKALEPSAAQARLDVYVEQLKGSLSSKRFTLHGFRSGAAISMALADISLDQIMDHVGWKSSKTALHYIKLKQVVNTAGPAAKLSNLSTDSGKEYKLVNSLKGFSKAFPE